MSACAFVYGIQSEPSTWLLPVGLQWAIWVWTGFDSFCPVLETAECPAPDKLLVVVKQQYIATNLLLNCEIPETVSFRVV